ncbi:helix-turn-helix domain-containing protein [Nocardia sp. MW-W600-9]
MTSATTGRIAGENLKRLRLDKGETQGECAQRLTSNGLPWTRDHVASLESGRKPSITVDELVLMAWAYRVPLAEFFQGEGDIQLSPDATATKATMRDLLQGRSRKPSIVTIDLSEAVEDDPVSDRIADRLGVELDQVMEVAQQLWGHTATKERDERLLSTPPSDPKALRTLRAGMTKRLLREVREHIQKGGE